MPLLRKTFPVDTNNPMEEHFHYYQEGADAPIASVAYVYHHGFEKFRWELLFFTAENPIIVNSLEDAEAKLTEEFGEIQDKEN